MTSEPIRHGEGAGGVPRGWMVVSGLVFLAALVLGYLGFDRYHRATGHPLPAWDLVYLSLQLFVLQSGLVEGPTPWMLVLARMLAAVLTASAVVLAVGGLCKERVRSFCLGRLRDHAVVCGVGRKAVTVIRDLRRQKVRVVAMDLDTGKFAQSLEDAGLYALAENATRPAGLLRARVHAARQVFIATGNDSTNIEIASQTIHLVRSRGRPAEQGRLTCLVHLVDRPTHELFRQHQVFRETVPLVDVRAFNVYDNAARLLWRRHLMALGPLAPSDRRRLHAVIGGMGQMGEAVLLRIAKSGHYANGLKPAVTVVDRQAGLVRSRLLHRYAAIESLCDIRFLEGDVDLPDTVREIGALLASPEDLGTVLLCTDQEHQNFGAALRLASSLGRPDVPIFVRLTLATGLAELLKAERSEAALARQVEAFGLLGDCCALEAVLEDSLNRFACRFHQAYVRNRLRAGSDPSEPAMKDWTDLDEQFRDSSCEQAEHLELKLRTFGYSTDAATGPRPAGFSDEQVEALARMEHARWCAERRLSGWTWAPPPKNAARRTSPYLVPWEDLAESVRQIDYDAVRAIPGILAQLGAGNHGAVLR